MAAVSPQAGDGRWEPYKTSLRYDDIVTRQMHEMPLNGAQGNSAEGPKRRTEDVYRTEASKRRVIVTADELTENDVLEIVRDHLSARDGCVIESYCSTLDRGVDIVARSPDGRRVYVEGKGGTSSQSHTARFGKAFSYGQHLSHVSRAVYTALKMRHEHPRDRVVLAFPDVPAVIHHFNGCRDPLDVLKVEVALVSGNRGLRWLVPLREKW